MKCNDEEGCDREEKCRGMCSKHYQRWLTQFHDSRYKRPFSLTLWGRWLAELNAEPNARLRAGIQAFRSACHPKEIQFAALRDIAMETRL